ncbi:hypothetical protein HK098_007609 [Nowakowskiella sp. JEL0407]|nr:hypothetical protein HK098_007609 [Nowakowskiella sp. JEL0407]
MAEVESQIRFAMNLNVLKRHDATVVSILDSSSHVVVYTFEPSSQSWNKRGIEGTMFVLQRNISPYYSVFILNRLNIENLNVPLSPDMEFQMTSDYVIYRHNDDEIVGLWIYEEPDRARLSQVLTELSKTTFPKPIEEYPQPPKKPKKQTPSAHSTHSLSANNNSQSTTQQSQTSTQHKQKSVTETTKEIKEKKKKKEKLPVDENLRSKEVVEVAKQNEILGLEDLWETIEDVFEASHTRVMHKGAFNESLKRLVEKEQFVTALYNAYSRDRSKGD